MQCDQCGQCYSLFFVVILCTRCLILLQVYDNSDSLKLNEAIEFIGILSVDPQLAASTMK